MSGLFMSKDLVFKRRASIDLGTNTCLLLVAECDSIAGHFLRAISDHSTIVRLGEGVDSHRAFSEDAMERTLKCIREYTKIVHQNGIFPSDVVATATSQARDSKNAADFFERVERETGIRFRILSGDQEAQATYAGALAPSVLPSEKISDAWVLDIGGGSTELLGPSGVLSNSSLDIGSVRLTERFFKSFAPDQVVSDDAFWSCQDEIDRALEKWAGRSGSALVGVAGTVVTLASCFLRLEKFDRVRLEGTVLLRGDVHRLVEEFKFRTPLERAKLPGIESGREDVILAGAMILWRVMEKQAFSKVIVSTRGLRYGVFSIYQ